MARRKGLRRAGERGAPPAEAQAAPAPGPRTGVAALIVAAVALVAFAGSLGNAFVFDDLTIIAENPVVQGPLDVGRIFGTPYWPEDQDGSHALYRPLTTLSFALERHLFGPGPRPVHATNVLLNALAAVLLLLWLRRLLGDGFVPLATALAWSVHPVHVEVVANGVGRSELLAAVAVFGGLLCHQLALEARAAWLGGALACLFAGLLAKESAVVLPALAFLADWLVRERGRLAGVIARLPLYLAHAVPLGAFLALRVLAVGAGTPAIQEVMAGATGFQRFMHACEVLLRQVGQLLVPLRTCGEYADFTRLVKDVQPSALALVALLAGVAAAAGLLALARRGRTDLVFAALFFAVAVLPVSNLAVAIGTVRADRLLYVPSAGVVLLVTLACARAAERAPGPARAVLALVVAVLGLRSAAESRTFRDPETFWGVTRERNPGSPLAWAWHGDFLRAAGRAAEAEAAFGRAIELRDGAGFFHVEAHTNLAQLLAARGERTAAEREYRLVLSKRPRHATALLNLGELLLSDPATAAEAESLLRRAAAEKPDDFRAPANLAQALSTQGRHEEAVAAIRQAQRLAPLIPDLWAVEGEQLRALGRSDEAALAFAEYRRRRGGSAP